MTKPRARDGHRPVSCIIPVYNGERYLAESLDSVLAQTYGPVEIIVVDDGSTDGTAAVLETYAARVRSFSQANRGTITARRLGVEHARGELVAFIDADDLWHEEKLERQVAFLLARPDLELCFTEMKNFWVPELEEERARFADHAMARSYQGFGFPTLLAHRRVFERLPLQGSDLDWRFALKSAAIPYATMDEVLCWRRIHTSNRSRAKGPESRDRILSLLKGHLDRRRSAGG
jgi:glycosyltransferase involved in cell wall biosynthesis